MDDVKNTEHRSDGYASPVYHASPWRTGYPRNGAAPIRKITLPPGHPSGVEEEQLLCELHVKSRAYWTQVAQELENPLAVVRIT